MWGSMDVLFFLEKKPSTKPFGVEGFFGAVLGLCWANVGPMLGHLMAMWGSMPFFWRKNLQQNLLVLRVFFWAVLGLCWANVGPMLGHLVGYVGFHGRSFLGKKNLNRTPLVLRCLWGRFGAMLGQCWGNVGPMLGQCWANIGPMGCMLGSCWVIWWAV